MHERSDYTLMRIRCARKLIQWDTPDEDEETYRSNELLSDEKETWTSVEDYKFSLIFDLDLLLTLKNQSSLIKLNITKNVDDGRVLSSTVCLNLLVCFFRFEIFEKYKHEIQSK
jgi:hypothetical protein